jgi:hypothetical protein
MCTLRAPRADIATKAGMIQLMTPRILSPNVWKEDTNVASQLKTEIDI